MSPVQLDDESCPAGTCDRSDDYIIWITTCSNLSAVFVTLALTMRPSVIARYSVSAFLGIATLTLTLSLTVIAWCPERLRDIFNSASTMAYTARPFSSALMAPLTRSTLFDQGQVRVRDTVWVRLRSNLVLGHSAVCAEHCCEQRCVLFWREAICHPFRVDLGTRMQRFQGGIQRVKLFTGTPSAAALHVGG